MKKVIAIILSILTVLGLFGGLAMTAHAGKTDASDSVFYDDLVAEFGEGSIAVVQEHNPNELTGTQKTAQRWSLVFTVLLVLFAIDSWSYSRRGCNHKNNNKKIKKHY